MATIDTGTEELLCEHQERVARGHAESSAQKEFSQQRAYAEGLANGPALALSRMKWNVRWGACQGLQESLAMEAEHMLASFQSEDAREAIRAFSEKRKATFKFR